MDACSIREKQCNQPSIICTTGKKTAEGLDFIGLMDLLIYDPGVVDRLRRFDRKIKGPRNEVFEVDSLPLR